MVRSSVSESAENLNLATCTALSGDKKWPHLWGHVSRGYEWVGNVRKGDARSDTGSDAENRE